MPDLAYSMKSHHEDEGDAGRRVLRPGDAYFEGKVSRGITADSAKAPANITIPTTRATHGLC